MQPRIVRDHHDITVVDLPPHIAYRPDLDPARPWQLQGRAYSANTGAVTCTWTSPPVASRAEAEAERELRMASAQPDDASPVRVVYRLNRWPEGKTAIWLAKSREWIEYVALVWAGTLTILATEPAN